MLEVYLNSLVAGIMTAENEGGTASGYTEGNSSATTNNVTLSQSTYTGATGASSPWSFSGGFSITNSNSKTYTTGSELGIKFSAATQYTVNLPSGAVVDSVKFVGYDNYTGQDSYISELNGTAYDSTKYVFTQKTASGTYTVCSRAVPLITPASGSFTFTVAGKQTVVYLVLTVQTSTGLSTQTIVATDPDTPVNVYSIDGRIILKNIIRREAIKQLPNGIYIIGHQKVAIIRQ